MKVSTQEARVSKVKRHFEVTRVRSDPKIKRLGLGVRRDGESQRRERNTRPARGLAGKSETKTPKRSRLSQLREHIIGYEIR